MDDTNPTPNVEVNNQPEPAENPTNEPVAPTPVPDPTMPQPEPAENPTNEPVAPTPVPDPTMPQPEPAENPTNEPVAPTPDQTPASMPAQNPTDMSAPKKSFMQKLLHPFSKN